LLPLAAGVAVAEAAGEFGVRAELKWPNDALVAGRKLAGVLAEAASGAAGVEWVSLGIGVNVRGRQEQLPVELHGQVASLQEGGRAPEVAEAGAAVLAHLRVWYDAVGSAAAEVVSAWRSRAVCWWGEPVEIRTGGATLRVRLRDVAADGALVVEMPDGQAMRLLSGEVLGVRRAG
jgi:BirA family biotin operon repressor/biotin-[acetyl-CoA-carboxylase] ligase